MKLLDRHGLNGLLAVSFLLLSSNAVRADGILLTNQGLGTIGVYSTSGTTLNGALITGLDVPQGIAVDGSLLFVANGNSSPSHNAVCPLTVRRGCATLRPIIRSYLHRKLSVSKRVLYATSAEGSSPAGLFIQRRSPVTHPNNKGLT